MGRKKVDPTKYIGLKYEGKEITKQIKGTLFEYKCSCGNISSTNIYDFQNHKYCNKCLNRKKGNINPNTEEIIKLRKEGKTIIYIGLQSNISPQRVHQILKANKIIYQKPDNTERNKQIIKMYKQGELYKTIAEKFNISKFPIQMIIHTEIKKGRLKKRSNKILKKPEKYTGKTFGHRKILYKISGYGLLAKYKYQCECSHIGITTANSLVRTTRCVKCAAKYRKNNG